MKHARLPISLADVLRPDWIMHDPFSLFQRLRAASPLCWDEALSIGMVTGSHESIALLHDHRFLPRAGPGQALNLSHSARSPCDNALRTMSHRMFLQENGSHTRLRCLCAAPLACARAGRLRRQMRLLAQALLDRVIVRDRMELLHDCVYPSVGGVLAGLPGMLCQNRRQGIHRSCLVEHLLAEAPYSQPQAVEWLADLAAFVTDVRGLLAWRQCVAPQNVLQRLVAAWKQEQQLSNIVFLLFAGRAPTTQTIGKRCAFLLRYPALRQHLKQTPALLASAVKKVLRFDGPVVSVLRFARKDLPRAGRSLARRQGIMVCLAAANRDPARFSAPEHVDLQRTEPHLASGQRAYVCPGAFLVRALIGEALSTVDCACSRTQRRSQ